MGQRGRVIRGVLACAITAGVLWPTAASSSSDPVLVAGRVLDPSGRAIPGAVVSAYLNVPTINHRVQRGKAVVPLVASTRSGGDGGYIIQSAYTAELRNAARVHGQVNFLLVVIGSQPFSYSFSRAFSDGEWEAETDAVIDVTLAPGGTKRMRASPDECTLLSDVLSTKITQTTIGELHAPKDTVDYYMEYGTKADSDIGIGFSLVNVFDPSNWDSQGTVHMGEEEGAIEKFDHTEDKWGHRINTRFHYNDKQYDYICGFYTETWYQIEADYWVPYEATGDDISYLDGHCDESGHVLSDFLKNGQFTRTKNEYVTFSFAIPLIWGMKDMFTSQTGISTLTNLHWTFGSGKSHHYLCSDSDGEGIATSDRIYAGVDPF